MSLPSYVSQSFLSFFPPEDLAPVLQQSITQSFSSEEEVIKPDNKSHLFLIVEGEVLLCDPRNPRIEIQTAVAGRSLEMSKYFSQNNWSYFWKAKKNTKILKIPSAEIMKLLQKHPVFGEYLSRISNNTELQKFNRMLRQLNIPYPARIEFIANLKKAPFEEVFANFDSKKFLLLSSGRLRINFYLDGGKHPLIDLQGGDDAVVDLRSDSRSIDLIEKGEAWFIEDTFWKTFKNHANIERFINFYESKLSRSSEKTENNPGVTAPQQSGGNLREIFELSPFNIQWTRLASLGILLVFISGVLAIVLQFGSSLLNRIIFDHTLPNQDFIEAGIIVSATFFMSLFSEFIQKNIQKIVSFASATTRVKISSNLLNAISNAQKRYFEGNKISDLVEGFNNFLQATQLWNKFFADSISFVISLIAVTLLLFFILPQMGTIIGLTLFGFIITSVLLNLLGQANQKNKIASDQEHFENSFELISQAQMFKSHNLWPVLKSHWLATQNSSTYKGFIDSFFQDFENNFLELVVETIKLFILFFAVKLYFEKQLSLGLVVALPLILGVYLAQLRKFHTQFRMFFTTLQTSSKGRKIFPIPQEVEDRRKPQNPENLIEIRKMNYTYSTRQSLFSIKDLNLDIKNGEKVLILGPSGSGKSTLLGLISGNLGFHPAVFKSYIGEDQLFLPQHSDILAGTIIDNIAGFREDISLDSIQEVSQDLDLTPVIERLPDSFQTQLDTRGNYFSDGQKQKLQIARLFFGKSKVCILDEATSLMDPLTEQRILDQLFLKVKSQTVLFATQRAHIVQYFDRVIFMVDGKILESGTHQELIEKHGAYFDYFCAQLRG